MPEEVLEVVFAKLPVPKIRHLRCPRIVTDRDTGQYKLFVGWRNHVPLVYAPNNVHSVMDIFDSKTEEWISLGYPGDGRPLLSRLDLWYPVPLGLGGAKGRRKHVSRPLRVGLC